MQSHGRLTLRKLNLLKHSKIRSEDLRQVRAACGTLSSQLSVVYKRHMSPTLSTYASSTCKQFSMT